MSTLKTGNITHPSSTGTAITLDASDNVNFNSNAVTGIASINGGQIGGNRNLVINGAMVISQRYGTAVQSPAPSGYGIDRFATFKSGSGTFSLAQSSDAPVGFTKSLLATVTSASTPSGGDYYLIQHPIEGQNLSVLSLGTANAQTSTLSFYVKSSLTGTFSGSLRDNPSGVSYVFQYTINSANTWERKSVSISGSTSGTFPTDNTAGARLAFSLGQGTTYATSTVGSWVSGNYHGSTTETDFIATNGATFYITGVQLETGSQATAFQHEDYGTTLQKCQRYFQKIEANASYHVFGQGMTYNTAAADIVIGVNHPVTMRTTPTLNNSGVSGFGVDPSNKTVSALNLYKHHANTTFVQVTASSGYSSGTAVQLIDRDASPTASLSFDAEL